jgi:periplasmic divalent cation tolerance protein
MTDYIQVSTTTETRSNADKIAKILLERRLAACVQILGPINSSYWWGRKIERAKEWLCLIKAQSRDYRRIELAIKKNHPYETPEVIALPILSGNNEYLRWIRKETRRKS